MTGPVLRALDDGVVLAGLKAKPSGWPPASLDPGCERRALTLGGGTGAKRSHKIRSLRFQGIAAGALHRRHAAAARPAIRPKTAPLVRPLPPG